MAEYSKVCKLSELPEGEGKLVEVDGSEIALFKDGGEVCAVHNICPHAGGPLSEGGVREGQVVCPWHGWEFNLRTGVCAFNPVIKVPVFKVKVEGDEVFVRA